MATSLTVGRSPLKPTPLPSQERTRRLDILPLQRQRPKQQSVELMLIF